MYYIFYAKDKLIIIITTTIIIIIKMIIIIIIVLHSIMTICQYWVMSWLDAITCVMLSKGVFPLSLSIFVSSK